MINVLVVTTKAMPFTLQADTWPEAIARTVQFADRERLNATTTHPAVVNDSSPVFMFEYGVSSNPEQHTIGSLRRDAKAQA